MITIYKQNGLRAEVVDSEAIALYSEGGHVLTMTVEEWRGINAVLESEMEEVE